MVGLYLLLIIYDLLALRLSMGGAWSVLSAFLAFGFRFHILFSYLASLLPHYHSIMPHLKLSPIISTKSTSILPLLR